MYVYMLFATDRFLLICEQYEKIVKKEATLSQR